MNECLEVSIGRGTEHERGRKRKKKKNERERKKKRGKVNVCRQWVYVGQAEDILVLKAIPSIALCDLKFDVLPVHNFLTH